jgi:hypothetical protein
MSDTCGEIIECERCHALCDSNAWEKGLTYNGIDKHHNPPEFISNFLKEKWSGEIYSLCRNCHVKLHKEIKKILYKNSNSLKFINSEDWLLKKMNVNQIKKAKEEIYFFTKEWIKKGKEDDTTTT